jgi:hypothetical protein
MAGRSLAKSLVTGAASHVISICAYRGTCLGWGREGACEAVRNCSWHKLGPPMLVKTLGPEDYILRTRPSHVHADFATIHDDSLLFCGASESCRIKLEWRR